MKPGAPDQSERTPLLGGSSSSSNSGLAVSIGISDRGRNGDDEASAKGFLERLGSVGDSALSMASSWLLLLSASRLLSFTGARFSPARGAAFLASFLGSLALMFGGWLLSCLGSVAPLTVCYDSGDRIFFFGGYGDIVDCPARGTWPPAPFQVRTEEALVFFGTTRFRQ